MSIQFDEWRQDKMSDEVRQWVFENAPDGPIRDKLFDLLDNYKAMKQDADEYRAILKIALEDSLASDGLDMIHFAMRDDAN